MNRNRQQLTEDAEVTHCFPCNNNFSYVYLTPFLCVHAQQEGGLKLTFQKQGLPLKRPLESEEGPQAQQQYLARLHELQSASDTGLADITKPQCSFQTGAFYMKSCQYKMYTLVSRVGHSVLPPLDGSKI